VFPEVIDAEGMFDLKLQITDPNSLLIIDATVPDRRVFGLIHQLATFMSDSTVTTKVSVYDDVWSVTTSSKGVVLLRGDELIGFNPNEVDGLIQWLMTATKSDEGIVFSESGKTLN
jgi:hypothetical protein